MCVCVCVCERERERESEGVSRGDLEQLPKPTVGVEAVVVVHGMGKSENV